LTTVRRKETYAARKVNNESGTHVPENKQLSKQTLGKMEEQDTRKISVYGSAKRNKAKIEITNTMLKSWLKTCTRAIKVLFCLNTAVS
jgi:hypothetical protein